MPLGLYPPSVLKGDLSPDAFGEKIDHVCQEIQEACKGFGTDEDRLIRALGGQRPEARYKIAIRYKELYGKELKDVMKSECGSRDFGTALQFMAVSPDAAECDMIVAACSGVGTNEQLIYPIVCGRTNQEMNLLKQQFFQRHNKDLGSYLASELGGNLQQLVLNALQASEEAYDPHYHNESKAQQDVELLYKAGTGRMGTDESTLFKFICAAPPQYLTLVNTTYAEKYGYTLSKVLEKELGGILEEAAVFLFNMKLKPAQAVAQLIHRACAGFGTNELLLTCCLIRYDKVMDQVNAAYVELYGKTVADVVKSETTGDYRKLLLELVK